MVFYESHLNPTSDIIDVYRYFWKKQDYLQLKCNPNLVNKAAQSFAYIFHDDSI